MLVLEGLVGLHRTIQLQLLQHYCLGHRRITVILKVCLETNRDHSVIFEMHPSTAFQTLLPHRTRPSFPLSQSILDSTYK